MKQSKQLVLGGAIVVALLAVMVSLLIIPANRKRDALHADSMRKLTAIARFNELAESSGAVTAKIGNLHQTIALLQDRIPSATRMNSIAENLWHLAEANSLQTRTLKTAPGKPNGAYVTQDINFSLTGGYSAFYQFMLQVEQLPYAVRVESLTLNRAAGRDGEMQADLTLSVLLHSEPARASSSMANVSIDPR